MIQRLSATAVVLLSVLVAGCGGGGGNGSGSSGSGTIANNTPGSVAQAAYKFADCMRQHGVPNFPDPHVSVHAGGGSVSQEAPSGNPNSPAMKSAQKACRGILPGVANQSPAQQAEQQHAQELGLVSFARCMRTHGVQSFPDPTAQGQINPSTLSAAGVDIHAPAVIKAAMGCVSSSQGQVTRAAIGQVESSGS